MLCTGLLTETPKRRHFAAAELFNKSGPPRPTLGRLIHRCVLRRRISVDKFCFCPPFHRHDFTANSFFTCLSLPTPRSTSVTENRNHPLRAGGLSRTVEAALRRSGCRLFLALHRYLSAFEVSKTAFPFLNLVALLAHKSLYNVNPIRMLGREL